MATLYFSNMGQFDLRAMLTFGVSAKRAENPIGHFGTGFKYAVAITLRLGGSISVQTRIDGEWKTYQFTAQIEQIRDKEFCMVKVNGEDAHFTTHLGIGWEPWMAFRELYSNMLDESGQISTEYPHSAETIIEVNCPQIWEAYQSKSDYFLQGQPMHVDEDSGIEIHPGPGKFMYFRGIAVHRLDENRPTRFRYNKLRGVDLTEERIAKFPWQLRAYAAYALQNCPDDLICSVIHRDKGFDEELFEFDPSRPVSAAFLAAARELKELPATQSGGLKNKTIAEVLSANKNRNYEFTPHIMSPVQSYALDRALNFLDKLDIRFQGVDINAYSDMDELIRRKGTQIYLSHDLLESGTKQIALALFGSWLGMRRKMAEDHGQPADDQPNIEWLMRRILTMGESIVGETL